MRKPSHSGGVALEYVLVLVLMGAAVFVGANAVASSIKAGFVNAAAQIAVTSSVR